MYNLNVSKKSHMFRCLQDFFRYAKVTGQSFVHALKSFKRISLPINYYKVDVTCSVTLTLNEVVKWILVSHFMLL